jgi:hypothetical protein
MGIRSTNPTQSFGDEQNVRSVGNPFSAFKDTFSGTGRDAARRPHPGGPAIANGGERFKVPLAAAPAPTGGGYVYHIFTDTSAPATFEVEYGTNINLLMVGGGGAGQSGGGGAGGIAHAINLPTGMPLGGSSAPFIATINVGAGHEHPAPASTPQTTGGDSTFVYTPLEDPSTPITITALGGGNGGSNGSGSAGGSGGGGGRGNVSVFPTSQYFNAGPGQQPNQNPGLPFVTNYGNGIGSPPTNTQIPGGSSAYWRSFGGGGASEPAGTNATPSVSDQVKTGGAGQPFTIVPGPIIYTYAPSPLQSTLGTAWRDALGPTGIMGGGGGGHHHDSSTAGGVGGAGGGGAGGYDRLTPDGFLPATYPSPTLAGNPGVDYTGSGGGAWLGVSPGNGGKGIIIVYYYVGDD